MLFVVDTEAWDKGRSYGPGMSRLVDWLIDILIRMGTMDGANGGYAVLKM